MTALCRSYASHAEAQQAVHDLLGEGIPGGGVRVLAGERTHDARDARTGGFAGTVGPDAPVGSFGGAPHAQREAMGTFAGGEQRRGSFADADRDVVSSYPDGVEQMHIAGHGRLERLLASAGLDDAAVARDVAALHEGRVLLLVEVDGADADRARAVLGG